MRICGSDTRPAYRYGLCGVRCRCGWDGKGLVLGLGEERDGDYLRHIMNEFEGYARQKWVRCLVAIHSLFGGQQTREYVLM